MLEKFVTPRLYLFSLLTLLALPLAAQDEHFSPAALTELPGSGWHTNGGDLYNRRFSPLTEINKDNVAELKAEWEIHLGSGSGPQNSGEAQPIIVDGTAYLITGDNDVFAIDIETGAILWVHYGELPQGMDTICCGWTSRGVGVGEGRLYVGRLDGRLMALDMEDGSVIWDIQVERWQEGFSITSAPLYYDGMVITGVSGGELGVRGRVKAYDAEDGSLLWTFYTIPGPGEFGHDTWQQDNELWQHGGATVWQTPAVDPELGLLYFSTGNAGPDYNGQHREGDNLFAASILAIDLHTGEYRWHFQEVHHDIWDYDASNPVILFDIEYQGEERKALAQAGKTGWVYILDRITGEPLIGIEERPVPQNAENKTAATQPYPLGEAFIPQSIIMPPEGYPMVNEGKIFTPYWTEPTVIAPGLAGGANWPPSALDPDTQTMYICANDRPFIYKSEELPEERPEAGEMYTGGGFLGYPLWNMGVFAAMNMHTNEIVWRRHWQDPCNSGVTATASGLLFVGRNDGRLVALDADDGSILWEFQTGAGMNAPVSIFEYEGTQYVMGYSAGNTLGPSPHGDGVFLFSLKGELEEAAPPGENEAARDIQAAAGEADLANGQQVFNTFCSSCHGTDGRGGHGGVSLENMYVPADVVTMVVEGRNRMPALGAAFTPEQLRDVAGYVSQHLTTP